MQTTTEPAADPDEPRRRLSLPGMKRALATLAGVFVGLGFVIWVNAGKIDGLGGSPAHAEAAGMRFPVQDSWTEYGRSQLRQLQGRQPRGTTVVGVWCPPVRRARVPFPCHAEPGYLYVSLSELTQRASAEGLLAAYGRGVRRRGTGVQLDAPARRRSRDNTFYSVMEYRYRSKGQQISGVAAVFDRPGASALVVAEGPDAAFRAVRAGIDRFSRLAVETPD